VKAIERGHDCAQSQAATMRGPHSGAGTGMSCRRKRRREKTPIKGEHKHGRGTVLSLPGPPREGAPAVLNGVTARPFESMALVSEGGALEKRLTAKANGTRTTSRFRARHMTNHSPNRVGIAPFLDDNCTVFESAPTLIC
jgi:hypothetical protein